MNYEKTATKLRNRIIQIRHLRKTLNKDNDKLVLIQLKTEYIHLMDMFLYYSHKHLKNRAHLSKIR